MDSLFFACIRRRFGLYARLVRLDRPIGTLLLIWPTLWALWAAAGAVGLPWPPLPMLLVFVAGTFLMRSAGCAINDYFDRDIDRHVARTRARVLTTGQIAPWEALAVAAVLAVIAFLLVLMLNALTIQLAFVAVLLAVTYPLMKRFFAVPQAYLGVAFGFGIPMAFAALHDALPAVAWLMLAANIAWTMAYDTEYAMVDRDDDLRLGLKTSAITFGRRDVAWVALSYVVSLLLLAACGAQLGYGWPYWTALVVAAVIAARHLVWIRGRDRQACFRAFLDNTWFGCAVFVGILVQVTILPIFLPRL